MQIKGKKRNLNHTLELFSSQCFSLSLSFSWDRCHLMRIILHSFPHSLYTYTTKMKGIRKGKPQRNYNYKHLETCFFFFMKSEEGEIKGRKRPRKIREKSESEGHPVVESSVGGEKNVFTTFLILTSSFS